MIDPLSLNISLAPKAPPRPVLPQRKLLQPIPDSPDSYVLEIDNSTLEHYTLCPRSFENYGVRARQKDRDVSPLEFGHLFHECEELRLTHGLTDAVRARQQELVMAHFVQYPVAPTDHRTAHRMLRLLEQYNSLYARDTWPESVLRDHEGQHFVERPFKIPLCTLNLNVLLPYYESELVVGSNKREKLFVRSLHIVWTGRIDVVLRQGNAVFVVDHKTSSRGGSEFFDAFTLSSQTVGYCWAAQKILDLPVFGFILNAIIIKPPTKTLYDNNELVRQTYFYSSDRILEWEDNVKSILTTLITDLQSGYFPQMARSFRSPCAMCDYTENCALPRHQRAADLQTSIYRDVTWDPTH